MTKKHFTRILVPMLLLIIGGILLLLPQRSPYIKEQGMVFGTVYHITWQPATGQALADSIRQLFADVDASLSMFNRESLLSRINRNEAVRTDCLFETVFLKAQEVAAATGGRFDITVAPLVNLWGFGFQHYETVSDSIIQRLLRTVGYRTVRLENHQLIKSHPETMLDMSAIAKGYACDAVAMLFERHQVANYLIEIGGEVVAKGVNAAGEVWHIGINRPVDDATSATNIIERVVLLSSGGMATSGNYRNFYMRDGKKYAHTIDPLTGYPVQHSLLSATIIADNGMTADAYATACMALGLEKSLALCRQTDNIEGFFIYDDCGELRMAYSDGFENCLQ
ncbi:MAG: FAD:protein FMN transferase [Prevotellaceae bacterium]|jgi:thiamine biosynthesis lipoprotein|nr:FAD:protein FMN transferase [Prevotellaceae bacterium]